MIDAKALAVIFQLKDAPKEVTAAIAAHSANYTRLQTAMVQFKLWRAERDAAQAESDITFAALDKAMQAWDPTADATIQVAT